MAVLADLLVRFGADSAELRKTLKTVESDLKRFRKDVSGISSALQGAFAAVGIQQAAEALTRFVVQGVEAADRMGRLASQAGITVEEMSKLAYAAELSGGSAETLGVGLKKLSTEMMAAAGGSAQSAAAFKAIGVEVTNADGTLRSTGDVLMDVADRFRGMQDGAGKAALATQLFGRSGVELIPVLNAGSVGLAELGAEAQRLGLVIDGKTAQAADELGDNFDRLRLLGQSFSVQLANELNPALKGLTDRLIETSSQTGNMHSFATVIAAALKGIATAAIAAWGAVDVFASNASAPLAALLLAIKGDLGSAAEAIKGWKKGTTESVEETVARIRAVWGNENGGGLVGTLTNTTPKKPPPILKAAKDGADEAEKAIRSLQNMLTGLETQAATFGQNDVAVMTYRLDQGDLKDELAAAGPMAAAYREQILAAAAALQTLKDGEAATAAETERLTAMVDESRGIIDSTRTPAETYAATIARLDDLLAQGALDQETYNRAVAKAGEAYVNANEEMKAFTQAGVEGLLGLGKAAFEGGDAVKKALQDMLTSFSNVIEQMISKWLVAQMMGLFGGVAGGGAGGETPGVGPVTAPEMITGSGKFDVPGVSASNLKSAGSSKRSTQVSLTVNTIDSASFDEYLARNEGVLGKRIASLVYQGRI